MSKEKLTDQAMKYLQKGDLKSAVKVFEKIIKDHPSDERTLQKLGDLYARLGEVKPALKHYGRVSEIYLKNGFHIKALAVYKQMILLDPDNSDLQLRLADMYQAQGLMSEAINEYHAVLQKAQQSGNVNEEMNVLRRLVNLEPSNLVTRVKLAEGMLNNGMVEEGVQEYLDTLAFLQNSNKLDDYTRVLARYLQHRPEDLERGRELAQLYLNKGEVKKGLTFLQSVLKLDPESLETLLLLAESFLQLKQYKKTITVYREMVQIIKRDGDTRRLQWVYERILELDPEDQEARLSLEQLPTQSQILQVVKEQSQAADLPELDDVEQIEVDLDEPDDVPLPDFGDAASTGAYHTVNAPTPQAMPQAPAAVAQPVAPSSVPPASKPSGSGYVTVVPRPHESGGSPAAFAKLMTEAEVFIKYGLHSQAEGRLRDILEQAPDNIRALDLLRDVYLALGSAQDAHVTLMQICLAHLRENRTQEALAILQEAVELRHDVSMAQGFMEKIKFGDTQSVMTEIQAMIQADPEMDFEAELAEPELAEPELEEAIFGEPVVDEPEVLVADDGELEVIVDDEELVVDLDSGVHVAAAEEEIPDVDIDDDLLVDDEIDIDEIEIEPEMMNESVPSPVGDEEEPLVAVESREDAALSDDDEALSDDDIEDGLEEADFFIQQGLYDEALEILEDLNLARPGREDITALLEKCHEGMDDQEGPKTLVAETSVPFEKVEEPVSTPAKPETAMPPSDPTLQGFPGLDKPGVEDDEPLDFGKPVSSEASQSTARKMPPPLPGKPPLSPPPSGQTSGLRKTPPPLPGKAVKPGAPKPPPPLPKPTPASSQAINLAEEILADLDDDSATGGSQSDAWMDDAIQHSPAKKATSSAVLSGHNGGEDLRHLNLGRSYREMGKPTEAINELQKCKAPDLRYEAVALIVACYIEKDVGMKAAQYLREALALPELTQERVKALRVLLAEAYERREEPSEALYFYNSVAALDAAYGEAAAKAEQLRMDGVEEGIDVDDLEDVLRSVNYQALPQGDPGSSTVPPASNKNNISYV